MTDALHFNIKFSDLNHEAQEAIIAEIVAQLTPTAKTEGEEFLKREWHDPKPKTWQEAYCRVNALEWILWQDYEKGTGPEVPPFMWETWQEEHTRHMAQVKAVAAFMITEVEVKI